MLLQYDELAAASAVATGVVTHAYIVSASVSTPVEASCSGVFFFC